MKERDIVRRLVAFARGRPLPRGETKQVYVGADRDVLIVAFVRMGGESRPWGIAYGHPNTSPAILTVPEGRNRDLVADMCAAFAPTLLCHVRTPGFVDEPAAGWEHLRPLRQVWLPNGEPYRHAPPLGVCVHVYRAGDQMLQRFSTRLVERLAGCSGRLSDLVSSMSSRPRMLSARRTRSQRSLRDWNTWASSSLGLMTTCHPISG